MTLKLFRATGHASILAPGEATFAPHPSRLAILTGAWISVAGNAALWRAIATGEGWPRAALISVALAAAAIFMLSLLGWRRTLKPAAIGLLLLTAFLAWGAWLSGSVDAIASAPDARGWWWPSAPSARSLLHWKAAVVFALVAAVPIFFVANARMRRLVGPIQLRANLRGMFYSLLVGGTASLALRLLPV